MSDGKIYFCHGEKSIEEDFNGVAKLVSNYKRIAASSSIEILDASSFRLFFWSPEFFVLFFSMPLLVVIWIVSRNHAVGFVNSCRLAIHFRKNCSPGLVVCFSPCLTFFGLFAKLFLCKYGFKSFLFKIDSMLVYYESLRPSNGVKVLINKARIILEVLFIRCFDSLHRSVFYVNNRDESRDSEFLRTCHYTIPNGVNLSKVVSKAIPTGELESTFSFHGDLSYHPNAECILRMRELNYFSHSAGCINVYGKGANLYEPSSHIVFKGFVEDINDVFCSHFYLSLVSNGAGIKNKALEALASGAFIIATQETFNGIPQAILGVNYYHIDLNLDLDKQIQSAVGYFSAWNEGDRRRYLLANRRIAELYDWRSASDRLMSLISG